VRRGDSEFFRTWLGTLLLGAVVLFTIAGVVGATQFR